MIKRRNRKGPSKFILKTYRILQNQQNFQIVSWSENATEFVIKDQHGFEQTILPKYFKHKNIKSFIRQLNMYGFRKLKHYQQKMIFRHMLFRKSSPQKLAQIKRQDKRRKNYSSDERIITQDTSNCIQDDDSIVVVDDDKISNYCEKQGPKKVKYSDQIQGVQENKSSFHIQLYQNKSIRKYISSHSFIFSNSKIQNQSVAFGLINQNEEHEFVSIDQYCYRQNSFYHQDY